MRMKNELLELAKSLDDGECARVVCPQCGGGSSKERSLSIRREGLSLHCRCWRARCELGYIRLLTDGTIGTRTTRSRLPRPAGWMGVTRPLPEDVEKEFNLNCFPDWVMLRMTDDGRLVIPILDHNGARRGDIVRQGKPYDSDKPKALTYHAQGYSGLAWFIPPNVSNPPLCVVEDAASAARLAKHGVAGVALLGVFLTQVKLNHILEWRRNAPVNIALDADAYRIAVGAAIRLQGQVDLRVHRIFDDVKDMDDGSLALLIASLAGVPDKSD